ncbi:MAG: DUF934 domain-containing protein [Pseudomonadota bacterium]
MTDNTDTNKWIIITDAGFQEPTHLLLEEGLDALLSDDLAPAVFIANDTNPDAVRPHFDRLELIIIDFPSFADGRGFSLATELRRLGYDKRLQARGQIISDQYAQARRCGFDEVAITIEQARRQPQAQWMEQVATIDETYQVRLEQADKVA